MLPKKQNYPTVSSLFAFQSNSLVLYSKVCRSERNDLITTTMTSSGHYFKQCKINNAVSASSTSNMLCLYGQAVVKCVKQLQQLINVPVTSLFLLGWSVVQWTQIESSVNQWTTERMVRWNGNCWSVVQQMGWSVMEMDASLIALDHHTCPSFILESFVTFTNCVVI